LAARDFQGTVVRELRGPRDLTMAEATRILGSKIDKPDLKYAQFPDAGVVGALTAAGFSESSARAFVEMSHAMNAGKLKGNQPGTTTVTGRIAFADFADTWAEAYRRA